MKCITFPQPLRVSLVSSGILFIGVIFLVYLFAHFSLFESIRRILNMLGEKVMVQESDCTERCLMGGMPSSGRMRQGSRILRRRVNGRGLRQRRATRKKLRWSWWITRMILVDLTGTLYVPGSQHDVARFLTWFYTNAHKITSVYASLDAAFALPNFL